MVNRSSLLICLKILIYFTLQAIFCFALVDHWNIGIVAYPIVFYFLIYFLEKRIKTSNPFSYLYEFILNFIIFIIEYLNDSKGIFSYCKMMLIFCFLIPFILYYFMHVSKNNKIVAIGFILFILNSFIFINYSVEFDMNQYYSTEEEWVNRNIIIESIEVVNRQNKNETIRIPKGICILDFWGRGCPQCFRDIPKIDIFERTHKNIHFVSIMLTNQKKYSEDLSLLLKLNNKPNSYLLINKKAIQELDIRGVPDYYILRDNKIIYRGNFERINTYLKN